MLKCNAIESCAAICVVLLSAGCSVVHTGVTPIDTQSGRPQGELVALEDPPLQAPTASVNDATIAPLSYSWWSESTGERRVHRPSATPDPAQIPRVPITSGITKLELATPVHPQRVELKTYAGLSNNGASGVVELVVCPGPCGTPTDDGRIWVPLELPPNARIAIVSVFWGAVLQTSSGPVPTTDYASYGFRWGGPG